MKMMFESSNGSRSSVKVIELPLANAYYGF
jgi:hypothetical protein